MAILLIPAEKRGRDDRTRLMVPFENPPFSKNESNSKFEARNPRLPKNLFGGQAKQAQIFKILNINLEFTKSASENPVLSLRLETEWMGMKDASAESRKKQTRC